VTERTNVSDTDTSTAMAKINSAAAQMSDPDRDAHLTANRWVFTGGLWYPPAQGYPMSLAIREALARQADATPD
jgi:hypothetical protein